MLHGHLKSRHCTLRSLYDPKSCGGRGARPKKKQGVPHVSLHPHKSVYMTPTRKVFCFVCAVACREWAKVRQRPSPHTAPVRRGFAVAPLWPRRPAVGPLVQCDCTLIPMQSQCEFKVNQTNVVSIRLHNTLNVCILNAMQCKTDMLWQLNVTTSSMRFQITMKIWFERALNMLSMRYKKETQIMSMHFPQNHRRDFKQHRTSKLGRVSWNGNAM